MDPNTPTSSSPESCSATLERAKEDLRSQPWKQHLAEIEKEAEEYKKSNSPDTNIFMVYEGFNDHGMSG